MLREKGLKVDIDTFEKLMKEQRERSKASWKGSGDRASSGDFKDLLERFGQNEFIGYEQTSASSSVIALLDDDFKEVQTLEKSGWMMLDKTPFYATSGGQTGDSGEIKEYGKVTQTQKFFDLNLSQVILEKPLHVNNQVEVVVDTSRNEIEKHHSATHLLHSALRNILGDHIAQAGSLVEKERLRFDFSHPKAMSRKEIQQVENFVNGVIARGVDSQTKIMSVDDAKNTGAMALFGEKYGDEVRVVSFGDASVELCGGTHVKNVGQIGSFIISKESGVSAGVRRIEAICGASALAYTKALRENLEQVKEAVKHKDALIGVEKLKTQIKTLKSEVEALEANAGKEVKSQNINGVEVVVDEMDAGDIKKAIDDFKNQKTHAAILLFQKKGDKVLIAAGVKDASIKAGDWIKKVAPIVGGGGGGRSDFAQAGGKDASKIEEAKKVALEFAQAGLKG